MILLFDPVGKAPSWRGENDNPGRFEVFTDGGLNVRESTDGEKTFHEAAQIGTGPGMLQRCNAYGCPFRGLQSSWVFGTWSQPGE